MARAHLPLRPRSRPRPGYPRSWGRIQETPGEDPYLSGRWAINYVRGLQEGDDPRYIKASADCKHFAA